MAYVFAAATLVLATGLRLGLDPWLGEHLSFSFYFIAVAVAAWMGGVWPAAVTALVSSAIAEFLFTHPRGQFRISDIEEAVALVLFLIVSLVIGVLAESSLRALERARNAEQAKDDFMATLAHELRSPLSVIHYANALNRLSAPGVTTEHSEMIDRQVQHLSLMVQDLLDVSRVARGKIRLELQAVSPAAVVEAALEKVRPLVESRRHKLHVSVSSEPMQLVADPIRLEQILSNLLTNAAKYTPEGGEIGVAVEAVEGAALFTVRDTGIGISEDLLPRVFDLFVQDDAASDCSDGGLGIGLALVQKLVELHGGSVEVFSDGEGMGSEFVVSLPLHQPAPAAANLVEA